MNESETITIGVPTGEYFTVSRDFHGCLMRALCYAHSQGYQCHYIGSASPKTADNRNAIANLMQGSHLFMVDADMTFEPETIVRMRTLSEKNPDAIITGLGFMGSPPFYPAIFRWNPEKMNASPVARWPEEQFEIDVCGSFGMMIPRTILEKIGKQAFSHIFLQNSETGESKEIRHDFAFCLRVKENGFRVICDPSIKFGHIRPYPIGEEDWKANREQMENPILTA